MSRRTKPKNILPQEEPNIKPKALSVKLDEIPDFLKKFKVWALWRFEYINGRWTKPPRQLNGEYAKVSDPSTWASFNEVQKAYENGEWDGIGIILHSEFKVIGGDGDRLKASEKKELCENCNGTYIEESPSGQGLRFFWKGILPIQGRRSGRFEIYSSGRFLTITGHRVSNTRDITEQSEAVNWFVEKYIENDQDKATEKRLELPGDNSRNLSPVMSDEEIKSRLSTAKNNGKFLSLWAGDVGGYPSDSEADSALAMLIGFYTQDLEQVARIMTESGLKRDKWERREHGEGYLYRTVRRALDSMDSFYKPKREYRKTETGNAERLVDRHGKVMHWCDPWRKWLFYDSRKWDIDSRRKIHNLVKSIILDIIREASEIEDDEQRKSALKFALSCERKNHKDAVLDLAKSEEGVPILPEELDRDEYLFNVLNGTLDLRTGTLRGHRREDLITKLSPVEYNSSASCERWLVFLSEIMNGDNELIEYLQRAIGFSLTGEPAEEFFILHGCGANGKSTFLKAVMALLGEDYAVQTPIQTLMIKQGPNTIPNDVARLRGARLIVAAEGEENMRLATGLVKQLTGKDRVAARFLHSEYFEFVVSGKLWIGTNHLPRIGDTSLAMWRRLKRIPFTVTIPPERRDPHLIKKLVKELPGILNWAIEGCLKWQKDGLKEPGAVTIATDKYRTESDFAERFLVDHCVRKITAEVKVKDLYENYRKWAEEGNERPVSKRRFNLALEEKGYESALGTGNYLVWYGIGLKEGNYDGDEESGLA